MMDLPEYFQTDTVDRRDGRWREKDKLIAQQMHHWGVKELLLSENRRSSLISTIAHIHFPNLKKLSLWDNQISSIERIAEMSMPSLKILELACNKIISVKVMRKVKWSQFQYLDIRNNFIVDGKSLTQSHFPGLSSLRVFWQLEGGDRFMNPSFILKLENQSLKIIQIKTNHLRTQRSIKGTITKKWDLVWIF